MEFRVTARPYRCIEIAFQVLLVRLGRPEGVFDDSDDADSGGEWPPAHRGPSTSSSV